MLGIDENSCLFPVKRGTHFLNDCLKANYDHPLQLLLLLLLLLAEHEEKKVAHKTVAATATASNTSWT